VLVVAVMASIRRAPRRRASLKNVSQKEPAQGARWKTGKARAVGGDLRRVAMIFDGPAFRTRLAFDAALSNLGVHQVPYRCASVSENLSLIPPRFSTARWMPSSSGPAITPAVSELAQHSQVPVINAMTDAGHPCEVISEAFTILERRGKLDGLRLTFVGEDTNLCRSWCELTTIFDLSVTQVCPPG
jgi:ornithine carbamoyltransferase